MFTPSLPAATEVPYIPGRGPVLLLSCMDLRLLNETVRFMDGDGLHNQYDHVILAGASLGALGAGSLDPKHHWRKTFDDHLNAAHDLHHFKDVYILEHRDCGAYKKFLGDAGTFDFTPTGQREEQKSHTKYARLLRDVLLKWAEVPNPGMRVLAFLMDLRGRPTPLDLDAVDEADAPDTSPQSPPPPPPPQRKKSKPKPPG